MKPLRNAALSFVLLAAVTSADCIAAPADPKLEFALGAAGGESAVANVTVQQLVAAPKKKALLLKSNKTGSIASGVAVRFALLKTRVLAEMPAALRSLSNSPNLQMHRFSLFAPGDPVPRLMAEEATFLDSGEWLLKRVLLADRPAAKECKLVWKPGQEPVLSLAKGNSLALASLLAANETP